MSDSQTINVKGPSGGTYETANLAGTVHDGMCNTTHKEGARYTANNSNIGQMGENGKATGTTFGESKKAKVRDTASMTSGEVLEEVCKAEVTQKTQEIFKAKKVTGALFLDGDLVDLLKALEITDHFDVMKLKVLRKKLEGKKNVEEM